MVKHSHPVMKSLFTFLSRTYKVLIVIGAAFFFFIGYNAYLIDHSLVNLRTTLEQTQDIKNLDNTNELVAALNQSILLEVSSRKLQPAQISKMELAKDIIANSKDVDEVREATYALKEVIKEKEKDRSIFLIALDKIGSVFAPAIARVPKERLFAQIKSIQEELTAVKDLGRKQDLYYELSTLYAQLELFPKAKEALQKTIELIPDNALSQKAKFNLAWNEKFMGNFDQALIEFEALAKSDRSAELAEFSKYQMADVFRKKGDFEKAIAIFKDIAQQGGTSELAKMSMLQAGSTYSRDLKDVAKAKEMLIQTKAMFLDSDFQKHIDTEVLPGLAIQYRVVGYTLLKQGFYELNPAKYKEAITQFQKALESAPNDGRSHTGMALAYLWLNDPDRALSYARQAVKLMPMDEVASINLSYIYIQLQIIDEAIIESKRFMATNPFSAVGYYNFGCALVAQNKFEDALAAFHQALQVNPTFCEAHNNEGWSYWKTGRYAEAAESFKHALDVKPDFLESLFNLGSVYQALGRYQEAKRQFSRVLTIDPTYPDAQKSLDQIEKLMDNNQ